ncbi:hypothetical protein [Serratia liquefaciens]|uniref:hypothetical protein n=1 Tax=Serratia liquefaciens TaxID=614 RepID=UPI0021C74869|nr:hypothetical protein [Serratia liquefaciens]
MDIVMGLTAALCWGGTDFLTDINARPVRVRRGVFFSQAIGLVIFSAWPLAKVVALCLKSA